MTFPTPRTMIVLPGAVSDISLLADLQAACAPGLDFLALGYPDWREIVSNDLTGADLVEDLAARALARQGGGPFQLTGYSLGAGLAHALALDLAGRGHAIGGLHLVDGARREPPPRRAPIWRLWRQDSRRRVRKIGRRMLIGGLAGRGGRRALRWLAAAGWPWPAEGPVYDLNRRITLYFHVRLADEILAMTEDARVPPVQAVLYRSQDHPPESSADLDWGACYPGLRIVSLPGSHFDILKGDNLRILAAHLTGAHPGSDAHPPVSGTETATGPRN